MDHIVYLDYKDKELDKLREGSKSMILRGAMGRKLPYGRVATGDRLFFIENKGDGMVKASAAVSEVLNSDQLTPEESAAMLAKHQDRLQLGSGLMKRFGGKRYLVLITVSGFSEIAPFRIDRSAYGNMDDWLPVGDAERVKIP